ncbi:MAG: glycoside hydrolase family 9 protein, partial [Oscillospiraceae bacterium]|nr:glycoside hydrolase family 9 protein [Oscillospiraceae bacterium]
MLSANILSLGSSLPVSAALTERDNFARLLQHSMYFYDANMCGTNVDENSRLSWRGDCHAYDAQVPLQPMNEKSVGTNLSQDFISKYKEVLDPDGDGCVDVSGGFHDAGDHVEFGMPENYSAAALGWGYYEFRDSYKATGQDDHIETILRYFNDYLMKCTFLDQDGKMIAHCYQVGDGDIDHALWQSPEVDTMARPAFFLTADKPQTDYVASAAASLAINYLNFKDTDPEYAAKSLKYAKAMFQFANDNPKELSDNDDGPGQYYLSSKWEDDYVWAGAWLYLCTEDKNYLTDVLPYVDYYAPPGWAFCWNDVWSGANTLLGIIDLQHPELDLQNMYRQAQGKNQYDDADFWLQIEKAITTWQNQYSTPQGYAFMIKWGSARYDTAMQLVTLIYDKYKNNDQPSSRSDWAKSQMEYLMGDNDITYLESDDKEHGSRCFVVGFNENSVKYPHHRAASGLTKCEDPAEQRHVLYGALVGGPDGDDAHKDITSDYIYNEVTIDYNAAFVGAAAGLYHFYGSPDDPIDEDFPPKEENSGENGGNNYWVEAFAVDDLHSDGSGVTKISFAVRTDSNKPSDQISVRYYFDASEIQNISSVQAMELYDQSAVEAGDDGADGVISQPKLYKDHIYYVEVSWNGYKIANSGKKYQFSVGMYYGDNWKPEGDYSYQDLPVLTDQEMFEDNSEVKTDRICVYDNGVLVGGTEPDGTKPAGNPDATPELSQESSSESSGNVLWGDANHNGEVDISDVVLMNRVYVGVDEISEKGLANADVDQSGKIELSDSMNVLKLLVHLLEPDNFP